MSKVNRSMSRIAFFSFAASLLLAAAALAADIEPPRVQLVDKFGVNVANGQVTHSLGTVSIGGAMGLSHRVSVIANEFNYLGYRGFQDKYYARARNVRLCVPPATCSPMNVMRVHDFDSTVSFGYYVGAVLQLEGTATSGYTYLSTGDERHILEAVGSELVWTKPDGTIVRFDRGGSSVPALQGGLLTSVTYPTGFTITVSPGAVNTNTGFQLKYFFELVNGPLDKVEPPGLQAPNVSSAWVLSNPKYIRGVNAAVEHCPWTTASCTPANAWPTATFEWPTGMPRTMYIGDSIVRVTDATGLTTKYTFRAQDLAYDEFGTVIAPYVPGREFSPRLYAITLPGATANKFTYEYKNLFASVDYGAGAYDIRLQSAGVVKQATRLGVTGTYDIAKNYFGDTQNDGSGVGGITRVHQQNYFGDPNATYYADTESGRVWYEESGRNFVRQFVKSAAPVETYAYTRGNLSGVSYSGPPAYSIAAEYPPSCTATTRRTCNQATRIRDANGNWTDYTYHPQSGQVATVTYPANKHGVRPQTRYTYQEKEAHYYGSSGTWITGSKIWLKTAEEYCINSSASEGTCANNDEVITSFEYNHHNLLLTGVTVSDPQGQIRRTCYRYDKYGHQIGVTTPNANLTNCPGVTP
jgi:hypothetical protein